MAGALAVMHWATQIDAEDVELVYGCPPTATIRTNPLYSDELMKIPTNSSTCLRDENKPTVRMWLLDFDRCERIGIDEVAVEQAAQASMLNDLYYPRPLATLDHDQEVWHTFRDRYLSKSRKLLPEVMGGLLRNKSIERVVELQQQRLDRRA